MFVNRELQKKWFLVTLEWMHVLSFHCETFTSQCIKGGEDIPPTFTFLWNCHPKPKDYFLAASQAGIALQGLPRLKAKDGTNVRNLSRTSLLLMTMRITLRSPLISALQISVACRNHAALNLSHTAHFEKRSTERSAMCTDLDLYYKWQLHRAK